MLGPLAVDGLMVMATGALLATGQHQHPRPRAAPAATVPVPDPGRQHHRPAAPTPPQRQHPGEPADGTRAGHRHRAGAGTIPASRPDPADVAARITPGRRHPGRPAVDPARRKPLHPDPAPSTTATRRRPSWTVPPQTSLSPRRSLPAHPADRRRRSCSPGPPRSPAVPHRARHPDHRRTARRPAQGDLRAGGPSPGRVGPRPDNPTTTDPDRQRHAREGDPVTVSTLSVVPEATASGTAPCAEPHRPALVPPLHRRPPAGRRPRRPTRLPDAWLDHVRPPPAAPARSGSPAPSPPSKPATGRMLSDRSTPRPCPTG